MALTSKDKLKLLMFSGEFVSRTCSPKRSMEKLEKTYKRLYALLENDIVTGVPNQG